MKRWLLSLAAALVAAALVGCSAGATAVSYGKTEVSAPMYEYWACSYKGVFSYTYTGYADNDSFWLGSGSAVSGGTVLEYLDGLVCENVKRTLVCAELYDRLGYRLSDSRYEAIDARLDQLQTDYADGSRNAFNELLAAYGVNRKILRQIYVMEDKVDALKTALFSDGGSLTLTDADREAYYLAHYARVRLILINDAYKYKVSADGQYYYDQTAGSYVTEELTAAELAEKQAKIAAVDAALAGGEDFLTVMAAYSEADDYYEEEGTYPNGYYLTADTSFVTDVRDAALALSVGEQTKLKTDYGTFYLLREEPDAGAWGNKDNADFFDGFDDAVTAARFLEYLAPYLSEVTVDHTVTAVFSLRNVTANYRF